MKWYPITTKAFVDLGDVRRVCQIKRLNPKTAWVKIMIGARTSITIKRHRIKHNLLAYIRVDRSKGVADGQVFHTTTED